MSPVVTNSHILSTTPEKGMFVKKKKVKPKIKKQEVSLLCKSPICNFSYEKGFVT